MCQRRSARSCLSICDVRDIDIIYISNGKVPNGLSSIVIAGQAAVAAVSAASPLPPTPPPAPPATGVSPSAPSLPVQTPPLAPSDCIMLPSTLVVDEGALAADEACA